MMKKNYFVGAIALCGMLTLGSCSNDDDPIIDGPNNEVAATGEQVIVLDMQDTDVLATKSRPLYSTENKGAEQVTDVKILVFQHQDGNQPMKLVKTFSISNWDASSEAYRYGQQYVLKLEGENKLANDGKTYTFLAVGQDESNTTAEKFSPYLILGNGAKDNTDGDYVSALEWTNLDASSYTWNNGTNFTDAFLTTKAKDAGKNEAEIFSGVSDPVSLTLNGGFNVEILLKRQVAGVLGYFNKIPAYVKKNGNDASAYQPVKKIRLVAMSKNTQINLTYNLGNQNDDATNVGTEHEVNGFAPATTADAAFMDAAGAYKVYEIDLANWFRTNSDANDASYWYATGTYAFTGNEGIPTLGSAWNYDSASNAEFPSLGWFNAIDNANDNPRVETNSVLAGEFMIAFERARANNDLHTFELQLIGGADDAILKAWDVKLNQESIDAGQGDDAYQFSIYRNHMYQIGEHGTDQEPGKPQPLDKDQELTIKINDQWEFIHDMEIE